MIRFQLKSHLNIAYHNRMNIALLSLSNVEIINAIVSKQNTSINKIKKYTKETNRLFVCRISILVCIVIRIHYPITPLSVARSIGQNRAALLSCFNGIRFMFNYPRNWRCILHARSRHVKIYNIIPKCDRCSSFYTVEMFRETRTHCRYARWNFRCEIHNGLILGGKKGSDFYKSILRDSIV